MSSMWEKVSVHLLSLQLLLILKIKGGYTKIRVKIESHMMKMIKYEFDPREISKSGSFKGWKFNFMLILVVSEQYAIT